MKWQLYKGCAIAQAVNGWLPTVLAWVPARVRSYGICGGQSGTGADFLRVLQFPMPIRIPPIVPQSPSIIRGWYNRPNSGHSTKWTQFHPMRNDYITFCLVGKAAYYVITVKTCRSFTAQYCIIWWHLEYSANEHSSYQNMLPICMVSPC
jgi:hypothetical protein